MQKRVTPRCLFRDGEGRAASCDGSQSLATCCLPCPTGEAALSQGVLLFPSLPADVLDVPPWPGIWFNWKWAALQNWALRFGTSHLVSTAKQAEKGWGREEGGNVVGTALEDVMKGPLTSGYAAVAG